MVNCRNSKIPGLAAILLFVGIGCAHNPEAQTLAASATTNLSTETSIQSKSPEPDKSEAVNSDAIENKEAEVDSVKENDADGSEEKAADAKNAEEKIAEDKPAADTQSQIPLDINKNVEKWVDYFTKVDRERFQRFLNRGEQYREVVENVLSENDLPPELYYLAMIESGYRTDAHSVAKAAGVWQFMAGTARRYGLRVDSAVDERRDPIRATEAAARYLRDLYNVFGSWHLAMAAYNAGEIRVLRAVFKGRTRNFWELVDAKSLPKETAEYVPKFIAVVQIGMDPKKYGFEVNEVTEPYPELETVSLPAFVAFKDFAVKIQMSEDQLMQINPQLNGKHAPKNGCEVWVPANLVQKAQAIASEIKPQKKPETKNNRTGRREVASNREDSKVHTVAEGESLSRIAARYKISVGHLKRMNGLKSSRIHAGMKLRTQVKKYSSPRYVRYKVQKGDNLKLIAKRFKTSVRSIKKVNELLSSKVMTGQTLKIQAAKGDENL